MIILVLTIAGVEKIIGYNDLSPQNDLSQPGQLIPFVLGIITVIEGLSSAWKPEPPHVEEHDDMSVNGPGGSPTFDHEGKGTEQWKEPV